MFKDDEELFADLNNDNDDMTNDNGNGMTSDITTTKEEEEEEIENNDLSGCLTRELELGNDFSLTNYIGNMGFEEVTDWEYYYEEEEEEEKRVVVQPSPFDPATPKRTRESSGSVVRLFRGEMQGRVSSMLRSKGMDTRVLIKEFSGEKALELAKAELEGISLLQSHLCKDIPSMDDDKRFIFEVMDLLEQAPFLGILGQVNVTEMLSDQMTNDANTWYRALGTGPPVYNSIWIVYPYAGLSSLQNYASKPPLLRILQQPRKKGFFGNIIPPNPLPAWENRANYIINGIFKQTLQALAYLHDNGIVHRSMGRSSIYLSTKLLDKNLPSSAYATSTTQLTIKLADFGFSRRISDLSRDEDFQATARTFRVDTRNYLTTTKFAIAEDLHALGYVFLGILLATLSEPNVNEGTNVSSLPPNDEITLQRLLNDIFSKDFKQFRSYIKDEENNIYRKLIDLLDEEDGVGWDFLESMCFARERVNGGKDLEILTANGLLSSSFFKSRI